MKSCKTSVESKWSEVRRARTLELLAARYAEHAVLVGRNVHRKAVKLVLSPNGLKYKGHARWSFAFAFKPDDDEMS